MLFLRSVIEFTLVLLAIYGFIHRAELLEWENKLFDKIFGWGEDND